MPVRPIVFARQDDLDELADQVEDIEATLHALTRVISVMLDDIDTLAAPFSGASWMPNTLHDIRVDPDNPAHEVDLNEETPEEEAARLRREAMAAAEAANESGPVATDPNDILDVPEEGRPVD